MTRPVGPSWRVLLADLRPDLSAALGAAAGAVESVLGRLGEGPLAPSAPEGVDGIGFRVPPARWLVSALLTAHEAPDLWWADALEGRVLGTRLRTEAPSRPEDVVVLFDAGPSQLGAARVVHVAALLVLHGRAAAAGLRLGWGVAQAEGLSWLDPDADPRAAAEALLAARTARLVTSEDLDGWDARVDAGVSRWWVGAPGGGWDRARRLEVSVVNGAWHVRGPAGRRTAPLPQDGAVRALLRAPFASSGGATGGLGGAALAGASGVVGVGHRRVVAVQRGDHVRVLRLRRPGPTEQPPFLRVGPWEPVPGTLRFVCLDGGRPRLAWLHGARLLSDDVQLGRALGTSLPARFAPADGPLAIASVNALHGYAVRDAAGTLWRVRAGDWEPLAEGAAAWWVEHGDLRAVCAVDGEPLRSLTWSAPDLPPVAATFRGSVDRIAAPVFGCGAVGVLTPAGPVIWDLRWPWARLRVVGAWDAACSQVLVGRRGADVGLATLRDDGVEGTTPARVPFVRRTTAPVACWWQDVRGRWLLGLQDTGEVLAVDLAAPDAVLPPQRVVAT